MAISHATADVKAGEETFVDVLIIGAGMSSPRYTLHLLDIVSDDDASQVQLVWYACPHFYRV